jgi:N-acetylglutamate synthase/N-acetylornithine aminotransferase
LLLHDLMLDLAATGVMDGEGQPSSLVAVTGNATDAVWNRMMAITQKLMVKTAIAGEDAN